MDLIVVVASAISLGRALYLLVQLQELGHRLLLAVTMVDDLVDGESRLDAEALSARLAVPVVPVVATQGQGLEQLRTSIWRALASRADAGTAADPSIDDGTRVGLAGGVGLAGVGSTVDWERQKGRVEARYQRVDAIVRDCWVAAPPDGDRESLGRQPEASAVRGRSERVDAVLLHPLWGALVFLATMAVMFNLLFWGAEPLTALLEAGVDLARGVVEASLPAGLFP